METLTVLCSILVAVWALEVLIYLGLYWSTRTRAGVTTQPRP
ncbi:MAG: hypothetical protein NTY35_09830 [Planctomycetota bacterium]|nr:hypothetical protein [Planctomycetota bacterium]